MFNNDVLFSGIIMLLGCFLCFDANNCWQKLSKERKKLRKSVKYKHIEHEDGLVDIVEASKVDTELTKEEDKDELENSLNSSSRILEPEENIS